MNDTTAAHRLREQLKKFVGIVFPHVPKLQKEFLGQMFFGIQAGQTTVLSRIARELDEDILLKKTEERLSRHLLAAKLDETVRDAVLAHGAAYVHDDTVVSIDPSDIQKPYAQEGGMPFLAKVWDGSKGRVGDNLGYNLCFATATPSMSRRIVPLRMTMWSAKEDGYTCTTGAGTETGSSTSSSPRGLTSSSGSSETGICCTGTAGASPRTSPGTAR